MCAASPISVYVPHWRHVAHGVGHNLFKHRHNTLKDIGMYSYYFWLTLSLVLVLGLHVVCKQEPFKGTIWNSGVIPKQTRNQLPLIYSYIFIIIDYANMEHYC